MNERITTTASLRATAEDYRSAFDLAFRVMSHKYFYAYLNEAFAENVLKPQGQRSTGLALSQVVFILLNAKEKWPEIETYLKTVRVEVTQKDETKALRAEFRAAFEEFARDERLVQKLKAQNNPTQPLELGMTSGANGFSRMDMFVNHPVLENPADPRSRELPPDDLHQLVIDFVNGARQDVWANVFDFDSQEIADAMIAAGGRGVRVHVGVDLGVFKERPEVQAVLAKLTGTSVEATLKKVDAAPSESLVLKSETHKNLKITLVNSVGLNHQKAVVRDVTDAKTAAALLLSGNFTYSCIHKNGDAAVLPEEIRPPQAKPNANHAVLLAGQLPAVVIEQELRKTLEYGIRGQSQYPLGGAFRILGPNDPETGRPTSVILTFSPNGGLGDINRDILARLLRVTRGPVVSAQFAFSSDILTSEIIARTLKESVRGTRDPFRSVGDPPFAMREWSAFLALSGYSRDMTTNMYRDIKNDPNSLVAPLARSLSAAEFETWRQAIRVGSREFGEMHVKLPDGTSFKISRKLHHKVWAFPEESISVVGTSFNPSQSAESNNEQILIVKDSRLARKTMGMFAYLYRESRSSVAAEAMRRNLFPRPDEPVTAFETRLNAEAGKNNRCPRLFGGKKAG